VTSDRPAAYRRIQWREFRSLRAAGDYADIGEEVQIHHYRASHEPGPARASRHELHRDDAA